MRWGVETPRNVRPTDPVATPGNEDAPRPPVCFRRTGDLEDAGVKQVHGRRACFKTPRGPARMDFGGGPGGEADASPQRAARAEPTPATGKRPLARRVFGERARWLRCSSVTGPPGTCFLVAPRHRALSPKTGPLAVLKQALRGVPDLRWLPGAEAQSAGASLERDEASAGVESGDADQFVAFTAWAGGWLGL